jgi:hypothetical protein
MTTFKEPRTKSKPDMLIWNIAKISDLPYDPEFSNEEYIGLYIGLYTEYSKALFDQFDLKDGFYVTDCDPPDVDHPNQSSETIGQCLCSQCNLVLHFIVRNRVTKKTCWVGSSCISKFLPQLVPEMKLYVAKRRALDLGIKNTCLYCDEPLIDLRRMFQREGYCDRHCQCKMEYTVMFGKYKGRNLIDLMITKDGSRYIKDFVKVQVARDPKAFLRYPAFLEIIFENDITEQ